MSANFENRRVINVRSPKNEDAYIRAYKEMNPRASRKDDYDISAVKTINGEYGHVLLKSSLNRSKDKNVHNGKDFISNNDLRKKM